LLYTDAESTEMNMQTGTAMKLQTTGTRKGPAIAGAIEEVFLLSDHRESLRRARV
jgi:hypothetical protein